MLFKAEVLYSYVHNDSDELDLVAGEIIEVLSTEEDPWWLCKNRLGTSGMAPNNYLKRVNLMPHAPKNNEVSKSAISPKFKVGSLRTKDSDIEELSKLRKEADEKIGALKYAVEKLERSVSISQKLSSPKQLKTNSYSGDNKDSFPSYSLPLEELIEKKIDKEIEITQNKLIDKMNQILAVGGSDNSSSKISPKIIPKNESFVSVQSSPTNSISSKISKYSPTLPNLSPSPARYDGKNITPRPLHLLPDISTNKSLESGFRYPPCRSVVYYPSSFDPKTHHHLNSVPQTRSLALDYVYAYDGDVSKYGGAVKGKNIMWLLDGRMVFPAASLIVILDIQLNTQSYFKGHVGDVTALSVHAEKNLAASAEHGKECRILIWDTETVDVKDSSSSYLVALEASSSLGIRMILGVSFSVDCKYLVAFGLADKNLIVIFEISSANVIAMARIGHNEVFQMGFNPFLFTPSSEHHDELILKAGKNTPEKSSSYTLVSCGGKQIKFWTLSEMIEKVDNDVNYAQEAQGFKGRKLVTTKKNQQWQRKYVFEGNNVVTSDSPDIVCYCCLYDGKRGKYAKSRVLTGTSSGSIYIWEQLEDDNVHGAAFWLPRGRLLSIVTGVHEGPIVDLDYTGPASYEEDKDNEEYPDEEGGDGDGWVERIVSGGLDGVVNTWKINRETQFEKNASPFHHETCVSIAASDTSLGQPRCVSFNIDCDSVVVGTGENNICMLSGFSTDKSIRTIEENIELKYLISGHVGKVKKAVSHPYKPIFATVSSDKSIRLWNMNDRRLLGVSRIAGKGSSLAFSPDGSQLVVGNEAGELIILTHNIINNNFEIPLSARETNNGWGLLLRRNLGPKIKTSPKKPKKMVKSVNKKNSSPTNNSSGGILNCEITCIAYSPNGDFIAAGCRDKLIHILSVSNAFRRIAICKGHQSAILNIDFSIDGRYIQANDSGREILFWEVSSGKQISQAAKVRDVEWNTWSCVYGWPCQGIHNGLEGTEQNGDVNAVVRSNDGKLLACGGSNTIDGAVKLFAFPVLDSAVPQFYGGHTSPVLDVSFSHSDEYMISAGGNDLCVFQWRLVTK